MIKLALFDCDGVIIFKKMLLGSGLADDWGIAQTKTLPFFQKWLPLCQTGKADFKKEVKPYLEEWGWKGTTADLVNYWIAVENAKVDERVRKQVDQLRARGIKCFLASNQEKYRGGDIWHKIGAHFDGHFFSYEVGAIKKEATYWIKVLPKLLVNPDEIVFFDDEPANVEMARKHKIKAIVYKSIEQIVA